MRKPLRPALCLVLLYISDIRCLTCVAVTCAATYLAVRPNEGAGAELKGRGSAKGKVDTGSAVHACLSAVQLEQDVGCKKAVWCVTSSSSC